jgi:hypothetical protein
MQPGIFEGRGDCIAALRQGLLQACTEGSREMFWVDDSFVDWPLSDAAVLSALSAWARPPRRLHLLALQYDDLRRRHPRFLQWRLNFGHCIEARAYEPQAVGSGGLAAALFTLGAPALSVRLFDREQWRGAFTLDAADTLRTREWFDALAQRSVESFAATTLGL